MWWRGWLRSKIGTTSVFSSVLLGSWGIVYRPEGSVTFTQTGVIYVNFMLPNTHPIDVFSMNWKLPIAIQKVDEKSM